MALYKFACSSVNFYICSLFAMEKKSQRNFYCILHAFSYKCLASLLIIHEIAIMDHIFIFIHPKS